MMFKNTILKWLMLGLTVCTLGSCGIVGNSKGEWQNFKTASVCAYKVMIIHRATFRPGDEGEKDFYNSISQQTKWLLKRGYIVSKPKFVYGNNVIQQEQIEYVIIKYHKKDE